MRKIVPFLALLLCALAFATVCFSADLSVSAESAVLIEASTGNILFEKNARTRMGMASTTKIMTALVALESSSPDTLVEIPPEAVGIEGSSIYLKAGETLTMEDLLYAVLLESANDAATAVAIAVAGSVDGFACLMNEKAAALGLIDTHFTNPHGLYHEEHYTTAFDLAKLSAYALRNPDFARITATKKKIIPLSGNEGSRVLLNHNKMLRLYDGAIGVKTGFTKRSGRCLVSAASRDGLTMIAVTLAAPNDWSDHSAMLDLGFASYTSVSLAQKGDFHLDIPLIGCNCASLSLSVHDNLTAALPVDHGEIQYTLEAPHYLFAPANQNTAIGRVIFSCDGEIIGEIPLCADKTVLAKHEKLSLWGRFLRLF